MNVAEMFLCVGRFVAIDIPGTHPLETWEKTSAALQTHPLSMQTVSAMVQSLGEEHHPRGVAGKNNVADVRPLKTRRCATPSIHYINSIDFLSESTP